MLLPDSEKFLDDVVSHIRFAFDRGAIRSELQNHIIDKTEFLMAKGTEQDTAEKQAVAEMGSAEEIGEALNKQHNPWAGWVWRVTNWVAVACITIFLLFVGIPVISSIIPRIPTANIKKSEIVSHIKVDKTVWIDDTVIHFTDLIYKENGDLNIFYSFRDKWFRMGGCIGSVLGKIQDNFGRTYQPSGEVTYGGIFANADIIASGFNPNADTLIISYDGYNRHYLLKIPLKSGERYE